MIFLKNDEKLKGLFLMLGILVWFGIMEFVMFGVNLCFRFVFIFVVIGLVIVGVVIFVVGVKVVLVGIGGIFVLLLIVL